MSKVAFELKSELTSGKKEDRFSGGSVTIGGAGRSVDLNDLLGTEGKIVLNPDAADLSQREKETDDAFAGRVSDEAERARKDELLVTALDRHPALKRATVNGEKSEEK